MTIYFLFFFFKQKTAYEIVSRDWSSDVCSSDLRARHNNIMTDDCVNNNIRIKGYRTHGVRPKIINYRMSVVHGKIVAYLSYTRRPAYDRRITYQSNV